MGPIMRANRCASAPIAFVIVGLTATIALGHDVWINHERRVNFQGEWCCNEHDCEPIPADAVKKNGVGFVLLSSGEVIPYAQAQLSGDNQHWRCKRHDGTTRCFFYPPHAS